MSQPTDTGSHSSVAARYGLVRPRDDRQIAGVCAGIGRATDSDPLLWRVLLAVGVLFGGVGLVAYLLGWLLMPEEGDTGSPLEALFGRGTSSTSSGVAVLLAGAAALLLTLTVQWTPFALAALGVAGYLLYRQRRAVSAAGATAPAPPEAGEGAPWAGERSPTGEGSQQPTAPVRAPEPEQGPEPGEETELLELAERYRNGGHLLETPPPQPAPPQPSPTPPASGDSAMAGPAPSSDDDAEPRRPRRRTSPALARIAVFAAMIALGVVAAVDLAGGRLGFSAYVSAALGVTGAALVAGAWRGRPPWLIGVGALLAVTLAISAAVESTDLNVSGNQTFHPTSVSQIRDAYTIDFGNARLDLRQVDFTGQDVRIDVEVNAGNLEMLLPPDVDLTGQARVQYGNAVVNGEEISGPDLDRRFANLGVDGEPGPGRIRLQISVNAGNLEVER